MSKQQKSHFFISLMICIFLLSSSKFTLVEYCSVLTRTWKQSCACRVADVRHRPHATTESLRVSLGHVFGRRWRGLYPKVTPRYHGDCDSDYDTTYVLQLLKAACTGVRLSTSQLLIAFSGKRQIGSATKMHRFRTEPL